MPPAKLKEIPHTVNVEIFAQYIFSRISRMALCARKYDVSENLNHYASNRIKCYVRENLSTRKCQMGLDARKYSSAKISTFTVLVHVEDGPTLNFKQALIIRIADSPCCFDIELLQETKLYHDVFT